MDDIREALMLGRQSDGKPVRRPLSPHLQVYRPQITSVLSIMHRFSGMAVAAASSPAAFARVQGFIASPIGWLLLFGWTAALYFHLLNGIRHLAWDLGCGFEKPEYHRSGWMVVIATAVLTVLTWIIGLAIW